MVLPDSHGVSRAPRYSGTALAVFGFRYGGITLCARTSQSVPLPTRGSIIAALQPRRIVIRRFRLFPFRSPLLWESRLISLPAGTEMFHFPAFPQPALYIQAGVTRSHKRLAGFPHSDTLGSKLAYQFPEAYRRLLRPSSAPDAKASTVCS